MIDFTLLLGQAAYTDSRDDVAAGMLVLGLFIFMVAIVISLVILAFVCILLFLGYNPLPDQYKRIPAWHVFLLMIPLFNIVWSFIVFPAISDSYKMYFTQNNRAMEFGDCGRSVGLYFAIAFAVAHVPCINYLVSWAALILVIIFLVKLFNMKSALTAPSPPMATPPSSA